MTTQAQLDAILIELEPELRQALLEALEGMRKGVDMAALRDAIERGDVEGVEEALNVDEGLFSPYVVAATLIYMRYGQAFAPTLGVRFNATAPAGTDMIRQNVERMTREAREAARDMAMQGIGRRETAKRIRDMLGLSRAQQSYVESMRQRLESGDPAQLRAILKGQALRDKRFDPAIKKAIETGKPISAGQIEKMTAAYSRKLLRKRAEDIAAAEAQQYAELSKYEAARQSGKHIRKIWRHSRIWLRARPDHVYMNGHEVEGVEMPFIMPDGIAMQYPHDPAGGAKHNANCRCRVRSKVIRDDV